MMVQVFMAGKLILVFFCLAFNFIHNQINRGVHVVFICLLGGYLCPVDINDYLCDVAALFKSRE